MELPEPRAKPPWPTEYPDDFLHDGFDFLLVLAAEVVCIHAAEIPYPVSVFVHPYGKKER